MNVFKEMFDSKEITPFESYKNYFFRIIEKYELDRNTVYSLDEKTHIFQFPVSEEHYVLFYLEEDDATLYVRVPYLNIPEKNLLAFYRFCLNSNWNLVDLRLALYRNEVLLTDRISIYKPIPPDDKFFEDYHETIRNTLNYLDKMIQEEGFFE